MIGAHLRRHGDVRWIADLRDSIVAKADRHYERALVRLKEKANRRLARTIARRADAIVCVTPTIAAQMSELGARGETLVIPNGADFDDFAKIEYQPGERFRITHTGNFIGELRTADRVWAEGLGLGDRLELTRFQPHAQAIASQRNSEALLLLIPHSAGRGTDVPSGKIYEYLAARRPILAAVPPAGAAAELVRTAGAGLVVPPDDSEAIRAALCELIELWQKGELADVELPSALVSGIDRKQRMREIAELIERVASD
jgi:glycosyltransferase involved in cell wall biosynthesis